MATYQNTATTEQNDVVIVVDLPESMHDVSGAADSSNARTRDVRATGDGIVDVGMDVGSYQPKDDVWVKFDVVVDGPLSGAGIQEISDLVTAHTNDGSKGADLTVVWL